MAMPARCRAWRALLRRRPSRFGKKNWTADASGTTRVGTRGTSPPDVAVVCVAAVRQEPIHGRTSSAMKYPCCCPPASICRDILVNTATWARRGPWQSVQRPRV